MCIDNITYTLTPITSTYYIQDVYIHSYTIMYMCAYIDYLHIYYYIHTMCIQAI